MFLFFIAQCSAFLYDIKTVGPLQRIEWSSSQTPFTSLEECVPPLPQIDPCPNNGTEVHRWIDTAPSSGTTTIQISVMNLTGTLIGGTFNYQTDCITTVHQICYYDSNTAVIEQIVRGPWANGTSSNYQPIIYNETFQGIVNSTPGRRRLIITTTVSRAPECNPADFQPLCPNGLTPLFVLQTIETNIVSNAAVAPTYAIQMNLKCRVVAKLFCPLPNQRKRDVVQPGIYDQDLFQLGSTTESSLNPSDASLGDQTSASQTNPGQTNSGQSNPNQNSPSQNNPGRNSASQTVLTSDRITETKIASLAYSSTTIDAQLFSDATVTLDSVTIVVPASFDGAFLQAPAFIVSGSLTIDLSDYDPSFDGQLQLFSVAPEGTFSSINLIGLSSCSSAELGDAGQLYVINTCVASSAFRINL